MFKGIDNKSNPPSKQSVNFYYYLLFCVPSAPMNPWNLSSVENPVSLNKSLRLFFWKENVSSRYFSVTISAAGAFALKN